jgi:type II secretory pathway predicted ATPase ExeA
MYESFYGLKERPFSMLPDPGFLYLSKKHQTALTMLEYALYNKAGFCVISGEIGAGKTTLLRKLLENMEDHITVGMITNTHESFGELLDWVLSAFGIHKPDLNRVEMHQLFLDYLLQQYSKNKTALLIVDEAQNMSVEALEELRMLSNINSGKDQLLQVIIAGQPELKDTLRRPELRQFVQRIAVDYHLGAMSLEETLGYVRHRLMTAGAKKDVFTPLACERIHVYSGGIPRLINLLCDTAMVYGFADQVELITDSLVDEMVRERMADSLVPIHHAGPHGITEKSRTPDSSTASHSRRGASAATNRLSQASAEHSKQAVKPSAEKKTVTDTHQPVAIHSQISGHQARLKAVVTQPALDQRAEPVELTSPLSEIEPSTKPASDSLLDVSAESGTASAEARKPPPRLQNRIEVRTMVETADEKSKWSGKWVLLVLLVLGGIAAVIMLSRVEYSVAPQPVKTRPAEVSPAPSPDDASSETSTEASQQAARLEQEREAQARRERAEAAARALQQQEAEAAAAAAEIKAEQEKAQREKEVAAAAVAAKKAEQARLAEKARLAAARAREAELEARLKVEQEARLAAEAEAARQRNLEQELRSAIEEQARQAVELERSQQQSRAQEQARPVPVSPPAPSPSASDANVDPELEFTTDPCTGPSAKFLSTCRK